MKAIKKRSVIVLGSTGSIGRQTVELLCIHRDYFEVVALTGHNNINLLAEQANLLQAQFVSTAPENMQALREFTKAKVLPGISDAISLGADVIIVAISGFSCMKFTMLAIGKCKILGIANKESIVCAWPFIRDRAQITNTTIIPIDSEANAVSRLCINAATQKNVRKITITASGGPFRNHTIEQLRHVTVSEAKHHPVWPMGTKISIDSATLMNKALEMIEIANIFDTKNIHVLIHPEAVVHGMIEFADSFYVAGLSKPNMKICIANALHWPQIIPCGNDTLDLGQIATLNFNAVDHERFPSIRIAQAVLEKMGNWPVILNAANEEAVRLFIEGNITFLQIYYIVEHTLSSIPHIKIDSLEAVEYYDSAARTSARGIASKLH